MCGMARPAGTGSRRRGDARRAGSRCLVCAPRPRRRDRAGALPGARARSWEALRQIALTGYADARLHGHILHSVQLVLLGFAAAVAIGVPLGLAMGWSRRVEALVNPAFLLIRPIPPLAWIPLAIVWLGLGDAAKVLVIWFAAFVPSVINSYAGVRAIEPHLLEAARMLGIGRWMLVREVLVPGARR